MNWELYTSYAGTVGVSLVEQELLTLPENLSSPRFFCGVRVTRYLLLYYILQIVVCPFVLFLLAIVLFVVLRFTDSDYPFDIFKLFLHKHEWFTIGKLKSYLLSQSFVLAFTVSFEVNVNVWSRPICICGILYFKLNGIDAINKITKPRIT